jgi:hypothetical protein
MAEGVSKLIAFYRGLISDSTGRMIADIWTWDDRRLEMVHDYIQWLFPLPDPSRFNPDAPRLTREAAVIFAGDQDLQARLLTSLDRMLTFYGLVRSPQGIARAPDFSAHRHWLTPLNHNHLRLTRMVLCLGYLHRQTEAQALGRCLGDIAQQEGVAAISPRTRAFWSEAITQPPSLP